MLVLLLSAALSACEERPSQPAVSYIEARAIVNRHCVSCHSEHPIIPAFPIAPNAVSLDTAEEMHRHAARIKARTIVDKSMPLLNKTAMTEDERALLGRWIDQGAKID